MSGAGAGDGDRRRVVLVTGASGFLGQFIVKLLHERDDDVTDIRTLDVQPFTKQLEYDDVKVVDSIVGDVSNLATVLKACHGVECVIHTAAVIDFSPNPDAAAMQQTNVKGTENVVKACLECGVRQLIYTSTVDVVVGWKRLLYARENQAPVPEKPLFRHYAQTKYAGEQIVLRANGTEHKNGKLHTLALRPVVTYGEGDPYYIINCLRGAASRGGVLVRLGTGAEFMQQTYVGNVAWAHLVSRRALIEQTEKASGLPYFITDDTMPCNMFDFVEPFLEARGFRVSNKFIPWWLIWLLLHFAQFILTLLSPVYKPEIKMPPIAQTTYACTTYVVNRIRATHNLNYAPIYSSDEAMGRAMKYYSVVKL